MDLNISIPIEIKSGRGTLLFPKALKRDSLTSTLRCHSIYITQNSGSAKEALFLICSGSYFRDREGSIQSNILSMFQNKPKHRLIQSELRVPINLAQDCLEVEIVNYNMERQSVSAYVVFEMVGHVENKLWII